MSRASRAGVVTILALAGWVGHGPAGAQAIQRGFELERAGRQADAAEAYLAAVRIQPANVAALLGLERVLPRLGRVAELLPLSQRAVAADPGSGALRGLLLRTYVGLERDDSAAALAGRWAAADPASEQPYREWALALQDRGRFAEARRVLLAGRGALGQPAALAVELAELAERGGRWESAAREWGAAVAVAPSYLPTAAERLRAAPPDERAAVLAVLLPADRSPAPARRLGAELMLAWGEADRAWAVLQSALDSSPADAAMALRRFADLAGATGTPAGRRVRGLALARFADFVPPALAARARTDAARALLEAGDAVAARQVLAALAADPAAPPEVQALAQAALIRALIDAGELDAAGAHLDSLGERLGGAERAALRLDLARVRLGRGELEAAERALVGDSGVEAAALRGWAALYRGDLARAAGLFREAGPYAGRPGEPTERSQMLALLQQVSAPRSPELGAALQRLARGDSSGAVAALMRVADHRALAAGRPEVLLLAGRVAARLGGAHETTATLLFADVVRTGGDGAAAPAAELEWARVLLRQGRAGDAIAHLEHLILTYPGSAVVPQARRDLERARGAIPRS